MAQELGPNQRKWIEELRSGKWQQGTEYLCIRGAYCCLGVGCEVFGIPSSDGTANVRDGEDDDGEEIFVDVPVKVFDGNKECAPQKLVDTLALRDEVGTPADKGVSLTGLNDYGKSFTEIADIIEADPAKWFLEPR